MGERARELLILLAGDGVVFIVSLHLTLTLRYLAWPSQDLLQEHVGPFFLLSALWLGVFYIVGLYGKHTTFLKKTLVGRLVNAQIVNVLIALFLFVVLPFGIAPKTNLVIYLLISLGLLTFWRLKIFPRFTIKQRLKAIVIADGDEVVELVDEINNNDRYGYTFVRIVDQQTAESTENFEAKLFSLIERENIKVIVADPSSHYTEKVLPGIFDYAFLKFEFVFLDFYKVYEETFDKVPYYALRYDWFITHVSQAQNLIYNFLKRVIDIIFAALLLLPSLLLFPFVALAIKLEDKGALFYVTERVGQHNRPIYIYKLRTKNGADSGDAALASTLVDTKVGAFLRKTRIDELPQLLNVLRGDLSFIGPRPEMPALAQVYAKEVAYYNARHFIKPGLSGWAQVNDHDAPRGGIDIERTVSKLSYDLYYLKNHSLALDIQVAMKTIAIIVMRTGT